jgi:hypothetical protein
MHQRLFIYVICVQHILCCFSLSCVPYKNVYCQFFWIVHFLLPLCYGLQMLMTAMSHKQEALLSLYNSPGYTYIVCVQSN